MVARYLQEARAIRGNVEGLLPNVYFGAARYDETSESVTQVMHIADRGREFAIVCSTPAAVLRELLRKHGSSDPLTLYREVVPLARQAFLGKFRRADWALEHLPRLMLELRCGDIAMARAA